MYHASRPTALRLFYESFSEPFMKFLTASLLSAALCGVALAETSPTPAPATQPASAATAEAQPATTQPAEAPGGLDTLAKRAGYAFGLSIGENLKAQSIEVDMEAMAKGLRDGFEGKEPVLNEQAAQMAIVELQQFVMAKQREKAAQAAAKNKAEGQAFLEKNKSAEGVKVTESGLQYIVEKEGEGQSPKSFDEVTVHYAGKLIDGTEFDSSYKRNEPVKFPVNGVIAGWTEALQLMKPGAKYKLFIPSDLAYGDEGVGDIIGPGAVLVFDVELIGITPQEPGHEGHNHAPGQQH